MLTGLSLWRVAPHLHWSESFALWLKETPTQRRTERLKLTLDAYLSDIKLFAEWFQQANGYEFEPSLLDAKAAKAYFGTLKQSAAPATYNRKLATVKLLAKWAGENDLLEADPCAWIPRLDATRESPRDVPEAEFKLLEQVAESGAHLLEENDLMKLRDLLIFQLMANAGMRIHEVVQLKAADVQLAKKRIHIVGKGKKPRNIKMDRGKLVETIKAWQRVAPAPLEETLVTDEKGLAIGRQAADTRFGMIAQKAGVDATPHCMRHTFIYRSLKECADKGWIKEKAIDFLCQQTGDTYAVIQQYYIRASESEICDVMGEL